MNLNTQLLSDTIVTVDTSIESPVFTGDVTQFYAKVTPTNGVLIGGGVQVNATHLSAVG